MSLDLEIKNSVDVLKNGGVILCPTDTVWGLSCDATNVTAINKIYKIKNRDSQMPLIILINNLTMLNIYVNNIPEIAYELMDLSNEPLTLIFSESKNLPINVISKEKSIAVRLCKDDFCSQLIYKLKKPVVSTSANISGSQTPTCFNQISNEIITKADYVVNYKQNITSKAKPSSIIKIESNGQFKIIR